VIAASVFFFFDASSHFHFVDCSCTSYFSSCRIFSVPSFLSPGAGLVQNGWAPCSFGFVRPGFVLPHVFPPPVSVFFDKRKVSFPVIFNFGALQRTSFLWANYSSPPCLILRLWPLAPFVHSVQFLEPLFSLCRPFFFSPFPRYMLVSAPFPRFADPPPQGAVSSDHSFLLLSVVFQSYPQYTGHAHSKVLIPPLSFFNPPPSFHPVDVWQVTPPHPSQQKSRHFPPPSMFGCDFSFFLNPLPLGPPF